MAYKDTSGYGNLYNQILGNTGAGGFRWNDQNTSAKLGGMADQFAGMFKNMTGRDPGDDDMSKMFQSLGGEVGGSALGFGGTGFSEFQNLMNPYIQNTYGKDIQNYQTQSQSDNLNKTSTMVQDLVNKTMGNTAAAFSDPTSKIYQTFSGGMNNLGITPSSGAFQAGAGSTIANSGLEAANAGLSSVGLPQIANIAGTANAPYAMSMQNMYPGLNSYGKRNGDMYDFNLQSELGQRMADQMAPGWAEKYAMPLATATIQAGGNVGSKAVSPTWICTELKNRGLLSDLEVDSLHSHLYKAFWKCPLKFVQYIAFGKLLVWLGNSTGTDWAVWKPEFYDYIIEEADPLGAVRKYESACWSLFSNVRRRLVEKVYA